jgi:hypothetical protein
MQTMDRRLAALLSLEANGLPTGPMSQTSLEESGPTQLEVVTSVPATGWRLLDDRSGWKACPIGIHVYPKSTEGEPA